MKVGGGQRRNNQPLMGMVKADGGWQQEHLGAAWQQGNLQSQDGRQLQKQAADKDARTSHCPKR